MKRRRFIEVSLLSVASPLAAPASGAGRLYGPPASVNAGRARHPRLMLSLADAGIPLPAMDYLSEFSELWHRILLNDAEMALFSDDPRGYMQAAGFHRSDDLLCDENVKMLVAAGSAEVKSALFSGNYGEVFSLLTTSGVLRKLDKTALSEHLASAFEGQRLELLEAVKDIPEDMDIDDVLLAVVSERSTSASNDSLIATAEIVRRLYGSRGVAPSAVVPVVAIAIAAILVAVGVSVTVAAGAGIVTAAAVITEVAVGGMPPLLPRSSHLDPAARGNFQRVLRLSHLTGDPQLLVASARELIEHEVSALVDALVINGILDKGSRRADTLKYVMSLYALKVAGIQAVDDVRRGCL